MITVLAFAFVIGVLVFVHELGHFLAARRIGVRVLKFSLGFGPRVIGFTLRKARTRIRARHCSVGRIRRARSRRVGRVIAQSPRPGRRFARGHRVNLVVGRR